MNKLIIDNHSDLTDLEALELVYAVVRGGRISNNGKQYCYATVYTNPNNGKRHSVRTDLNKKSDRFVIMEEVNANNLPKGFEE